MLAAEADPEAARFIDRWDRSRHEQAIADSDEGHLLILDGAEPVGFALLAGLRTGAGQIELRRIVVVPRGRGIGRRALALILGLAFEGLGAERVWLDVMVDNLRARRAYAAAGFVFDVLRRDALPGAAGTRLLAIMSVSRPGRGGAA